MVGSLKVACASLNPKNLNAICFGLNHEMVAAVSKIVGNKDVIKVANLKFV